MTIDISLKDHIGKILGLAKILGKVAKPLSKPIMTVLKGGKALKGGLLATSFGAYAFLFSPEFSLLILTSLFIHEYGHLWAMKKRGMETRGMYFLPMLGAAAVPKEDFESLDGLFFIAIMGPIFGTVEAIALGAIYYFTGAIIIAAAASWVALINLFNLIPMNPLDGGRLSASITYSLNDAAGFIIIALGVIVATVATFFTGAPLFLFLGLMGLIELLGQRRLYVEKEDMTKREIGWAAVSYVVLAGGLLLLMWSLQNVEGSRQAFEVMLA